MPIGFLEIFDVRVRVNIPQEDWGLFEKRLMEGFGGRFRFLGECDVDVDFRLEREGEALRFFVCGDEVYCGDEEVVFSVFEGYLRREVAARSNFVFVHSGVVGWRGKAILIPGYSYKGKTTLTAELVKLGADYYSDEYAIVREDGLVEPFPKFLSLRGIIDERRQFDIPVEFVNGKIGREPIPIGLVVITEYKPRARWRPKFLTKGQGLLEIVQHAAPFSSKPERTLKILEKALHSAIII
ncbi:MAG: hypothetical protein NZM17_08040, partial [Pyrinomonadaceae bacterium]|nr:hypothetical protein [Pyrinomonadaceae bacterium]